MKVMRANIEMIVEDLNNLAEAQTHHNLKMFTIEWKISCVVLNATIQI